MTDRDDLRAAVERLADEWDGRSFACWRAAAGFSVNHAAVGAADMASRDAQRIRDLLAEHPAPEPPSVCPHCGQVLPHSGTSWKEAGGCRSVEPPSGGEVTADELARTIWHTSRADESTISATGANIVAAAILARFDVRRKP